MADPVHPNWDGIAFRATTDKRGVVVTPTSAQTLPPYSFLPVADAADVLDLLREIAEALRKNDPESYFAVFLDELSDDLAAAIAICREPPTDAP